MTAQALYRKWRPRTFDELVGQKHVVRTLRNALLSGRIHHAYLFAGPRGTGKTTTARLLAKAVNCLGPEEERPCNECDICVAINEGRLLDLIEIDAASNTGVDDVRELRERVGFRPNEARYKVYVIDEVHMLSNAAFNALLKTLEEPPEHAIFVLATTEPHKILPTVLSRCQRFDFHRISIAEMVDRLAWLAEQEGIEVERKALELIARQATGSMRDAESLLDQLASYDEGGITVEEMQAALGIGADETVMRITQAMADGDVAKGLEAINAAVDEGTDPRQFARQMVEHLRALLLLRLGSGVVPPHIPESLLPALQDQAGAFSRRALAKGLRLFNQAAREAKGGWQPQLPLEMAFIEALLRSEPEDDAGDEGTSSAVEGRAARGGGRGTSRVQEPSVDRTAPAASSGGVPSEETGTGVAKEATAPEQPAQSDVAKDSPGTYEVAGSDSHMEDGSLSAEKVREQWSRFLDALRPQDLSLEALMRSCKPVGVEGDVVVLSFAHKFHRSKVEEDKKRHIVEDVISDLFGRQLRVRCVMHRGGESSLVPKTDQEGEAGHDSPEPDRSADPLVRMAVDELGAEVVHDVS
ncbi:MAG: DNA polymerase III subunit gamma/tau [Anaerolineae bacterium]|nr:DNA polymerase III subunit gamma/tau [Anaerolineae bacterium]